VTELLRGVEGGPGAYFRLRRSAEGILVRPGDRRRRATGDAGAAIALSPPPRVTDPPSPLREQLFEVCRASGASVDDVAQALVDVLMISLIAVGPPTSTPLSGMSAASVTPCSTTSIGPMTSTTPWSRRGGGPGSELGQRGGKAVPNQWREAAKYGLKASARPDQLSPPV
jgi:hypothetical protein